MNTTSVHRIFPAAFAIGIGLSWGSLGAAGASAIYDSFDYEAELVEIRAGGRGEIVVKDGGAGWDIRPAGWSFGFWGNLEDKGGEVTYQIAYPESLAVPGVAAKHFVASGGRFANREEELVISTLRKLDVQAGALAHAALPEGGDVLGRSVEGIGAGGKSVWIAALMQPGSEAFGAWLKLNNTAYGSGANAAGGLTFQMDGERSTLHVAQEWPILNRIRNPEAPGRGSTPIDVAADEAVLLVARIDFGSDWGGNTTFATSDIDAFNPETTPTDGLVTVWINPDLSAEPKASKATLEVPVFEFRFNAVSIRLAPGAAIDEIRLAPTFPELLLKN